MLVILFLGGPMFPGSWIIYSGTMLFSGRIYFLVICFPNFCCFESFVFIMNAV